MSASIYVRTCVSTYVSACVRTVRPNGMYQSARLRADSVPSGKTPCHYSGVCMQAGMGKNGVRALSRSSLTIRFPRSEHVLQQVVALGRPRSGRRFALLLTYRQSSQTWYTVPHGFTQTCPKSSFALTLVQRLCVVPWGSLSFSLCLPSRWPCIDSSPLSASLISFKAWEECVLAIVVFRGDASGIAVEEARGSSWQSFLSPLLLGAAESFDARVVVDSAFPRQNPKAAPIRAAIRSATSTTMAPANAKSNARRWDTVRARKTNGLRTYARSLSVPRVEVAV